MLPDGEVSSPRHVPSSAMNDADFGEHLDEVTFRADSVDHLMPQHLVSILASTQRRSRTTSLADPSSASRSLTPRPFSSTHRVTTGEEMQASDCVPDSASGLREEIQRIDQNRALSDADQNRARQQLYSGAYTAARAAEAERFRARMEAQRLTVTWSNHHDPATGERLRGCEHYPRNCKVRAPCCGMWVVCRHCHDHPAVVMDHEIDRFSITEVMCMLCWQVQPVGRKCENAECGTEFALYYCGKCKLYDGTPGKEIYHCEKCEICRVGSGLGRDNYHCDRCNACVNRENAEGYEHHCIEGALEGNCPVCSGRLQTSTNPVVFMRCGHAMHDACFKSYTVHNYVCPLCNKTLTNMQSYYGQIDEVMATEDLPVEYRNKKLEVLCHDCDRRSVTEYHFTYHKCQECKGFNTRVIGDRPESEEVRVLPARQREKALVKKGA